MPQSKGRNKSKKNKSKNQTQKPPPQKPPPQKPPSAELPNDPLEPKKSRWTKGRILKYLLALISIVGIPKSIDYYIQCNKSASQKLKEQKESNGEFKPKPLDNSSSSTKEKNIRDSFQISPPLPPSKLSDTPKILGILLPSSLLTIQPNIEIDLGADGAQMSRIGNWDFYAGVDVTKGPFQACRISDVYFNVKIISNRLFVSTSFNDVETNNLVDKIEYNKWTVYTPNSLGLQQSDTSLEVTDNHGYIITRVKFREPNKLLIQGYFAGTDTALVVSETSMCFLVKSQRSWMLREIKKIKSLKW